MTVYIVILFCLIYGILKYDRQVFNKGANLNYAIGYRFYIFVVSIMTIVAGLSYRLGIDTIYWMNEFEDYPNLANFKITELNSYIREPGWVLLNVISKSIINDFFLIKCLSAIAINIPIAIFIYKFSRYHFSLLLLYYLSYWLAFSFENIRETFASSIYLFAIIDYFERKDIKRYLIRAFPMVFFHQFALVPYLFTYLCTLLKSKRAIYITLFVIFVTSFSIMQLFGDFVELFGYVSSSASERADAYLNHEQYGLQSFSLQGAILHLVLNVIIPIVVMLDLLRNEYEKAVIMIFYVITGVASYYLNIVFRVTHYIAIIYLVFVLNYIIEGKSRIRIVPILFALSIVINIALKNIPIFIKPNESLFGSNAKTDVRYVPYHSILTKEKDSNRESFYRGMVHDRSIYKE